MKTVFAALVGGVVLAGASLGPAAAAPAALDPALAAGQGAATEAAYVCGPWGCRWRPGPRFYGGYRPRFYGGYGPRPFYGPRAFYGPRCFVRYTPWGPRRICR